MATLTQNLFARPYKAVAGRNGLLDKYFYFSMSLLIAAIVVWGFNHTIDANLFHPPCRGQSFSGFTLPPSPHGSSSSSLNPRWCAPTT